MFVEVINFELRPNEGSILGLVLFDPPPSLAEYFANQSRIVAFAGIVAVLDWGRIWHFKGEASVVAYLPQ